MHDLTKYKSLQMKFTEGMSRRGCGRVMLKSAKERGYKEKKNVRAICKLGVVRFENRVMFMKKVLLGV